MNSASEHDKNQNSETKNSLVNEKAHDKHMSIEHSNHSNHSNHLNDLNLKESSGHTDGSATSIKKDENVNHMNGKNYVNGEGKWRETIVERGKDILSSEASGVATAVAIVVGAALIEIELIPGLMIGAGAVVLGKLFPEMSGYVRPMFKGIVKAGFSATHKVRQILAEANEQVNDLVAEVKHEQNESNSYSTEHNSSATSSAKIQTESHLKELSTH